MRALSKILRWRKCLPADIPICSKLCRVTRAQGKWDRAVSARPCHHAADFSVFTAPARQVTSCGNIGHGFTSFYEVIPFYVVGKIRMPCASQRNRRNFRIFVDGLHRRLRGSQRNDRSRSGPDRSCRQALRPVERIGATNSSDWRRWSRRLSAAIWWRSGQLRFQPMIRHQHGGQASGDGMRIWRLF